MGINLWLAPQISEHCPKNNPAWSHWAVIMLTRPGHASTFTPRDGTAHECKTSAELMINRMLIARGIIIRLSTSSNRNAPTSIWVNGSMNLSKSTQRNQNSHKTNTTGDQSLWLTSQQNLQPHVSRGWTFLECPNVRSTATRNIVHINSSSHSSTTPVTNHAVSANENSAPATNKIIRMTNLQM